MSLELEFLRNSERRTVGLALFALGCASGGFWLRGGFLREAEAAEKDRVERVERIEATLRRMDKNLTRVLDRLGLEEKPAP